MITEALLSLVYYSGLIVLFVAQFTVSYNETVLPNKEAVMIELQEVEEQEASLT